MIDTKTSGRYQSIEHTWVPLTDGIRLSARIWLPADWIDSQTSVPAILEYIPYRKRDMVRSRDERNHPFFASNGYACVRVDMRGSGDSEGRFTDMYSDEELADVHEVIAWIVAQPWCDGSLGMMGTSWGGTSALQTAVDSDVLKAVIAVCATDNRYEDDIHHMGGCLLTDSIEWGASLPAIIAMPQASETAPNDWRALWLERLEHLSFPLKHWIEHETRDDYWLRGSVCEQPGRIKCPVLAIGGWSDRYSNTVMNLIEGNPETCWGIIGPWGHHYPDVGSPGPAMHFQQEALRWWDRWLKGNHNGVCQQPRLRAWCGEFQQAEDILLHRRGRWINETTWPADNVETIHYALNALPGKGNGEIMVDGFVDVPGHLTVGKQAGDTGYFGRPGGLPLDQAEDDAYSLLLETAVLESPVQILGKASLELDIRISESRSLIVVRLSDVAPDGGVSRVSFAVRNLALNPDFNPRKNPVKGKAFREKIVFPNIAHQFSKGHKIRVAISTSYWPMIWPSPRIGDMAININSAKLDLPQRGQDPESEQGFLLADLPLHNANVAGTVIERQQIENREENTICHRWFNPLSETEYPELGLKFSTRTSAEHYLCYLDPTSARSSFEHLLIAEYDGSRISVIGRASLHSSEKYFHPQVSLQVFENDIEIFNKDCACKIERKYS